jgi:hypothetical protein
LAFNLSDLRRQGRRYHKNTVEEEMTYRISYIDTSSAPFGAQRPAGETRTEHYASEPAALARARELLESVDCHNVLVSDGVREPVGGVCLQLKLGFTSE